MPSTVDTLTVTTETGDLPQLSSNVQQMFGFSGGVRAYGSRQRSQRILWAARVEM